MSNLSALGWFAAFHLPTLELSSSHALDSICNVLAPSYSIDPPILTLNLTGCERLYGKHRLQPLEPLVQQLQILFPPPLRGVVSTKEIIARTLCPSPWISGLVECPPGQEQDWLDRLPLDCIPYTQGSPGEKLLRYNLRCLGDVRKLGRKFICTHFGKSGEYLYGLACGMDPSKPFTDSKACLHQVSNLPRDTLHDAILQGELHQMCDALVHQLRTQGLSASRLLLQICYADGKKLHSYSKLPSPSHLFSELLEKAQSLMQQLHLRRVALRHFQLTATETCPTLKQCELFTEKDSRQLALGDTLEKVRRKHGMRAVGNPRPIDDSFC